MSEMRSFVTELDVEQERKRRQEEWERVRRPDQPAEPPEPEIDHRPLYVRLKEQREKAQLELDETTKLQRTVHGVDEDEVEFFQQVDRTRYEALRQIRDEENALIEEIKKQMAHTAEEEASVSAPQKPSDAPSESAVVTQQAAAASRPKMSKQASLLAKAIRKRDDKRQAPAKEERLSSIRGKRPHEPD